MTLLPAGACPSRRASLPTYLTPFQPSAGAQEDAGGRPFLPIESKSSRGYAYVTRFTTGVSESSGSTSRSDEDQSRLGFGEEAHQSPNPSSTMLETRSQGRGGSSGSDNSEVSVANRRRGSSTNSKGHNVNFQRVCDDELTINNQVGDLPSNVAHLIGRTKQAECVRALHIIERKSYEDEDVWPTASSREGEDSSSQRSDGFDDHLWDHIMGRGILPSGARPVLEMSGLSRAQSVLPTAVEPPFSRLSRRVMVSVLDAVAGELSAVSIFADRRIASSLVGLLAPAPGS
ncbi:hypothetical protein FOZ60_002216 [Perkinsus olseni]|uniref:Uncharacterized protein n=1 Tax=Perkinsus olseni TaxID=32597 RepID=A0A7J6NZF5_PEROL|nr:hypothetical protein FOZ60_002216 [Perkinsus olseni]